MLSTFWMPWTCNHRGSIKRLSPSPPPPQRDGEAGKAGVQAAGNPRDVPSRNPDTGRLGPVLKEVQGKETGARGAASPVGRLSGTRDGQDQECGYRVPITGRRTPDSFSRASSDKRVGVIKPNGGMTSHACRYSPANCARSFLPNDPSIQGTTCHRRPQPMQEAASSIEKVIP